MTLRLLFTLVITIIASIDTMHTNFTVRVPFTMIHIDSSASIRYIRSSVDRQIEAREALGSQQAGERWK